MTVSQGGGDTPRALYRMAEPALRAKQTLPAHKLKLQRTRDEKLLQIGFYFKNGLITMRTRHFISPQTSAGLKTDIETGDYTFDNGVRASLLTIFEQPPTEA